MGRLKWWFLLFAFCVLVPAAILVSYGRSFLHTEGLRLAAEAQHETDQALAAVSGEIQTLLSKIDASESARPWFQYRARFIPPDLLSMNVAFARSPLYPLPNDPLIRCYFEWNPANNKLSTPAALPATVRGDPAEEALAATQRRWVVALRPFLLPALETLYSERASIFETPVAEDVTSRIHLACHFDEGQLLHELEESEKGNKDSQQKLQTKWQQHKQVAERAKQSYAFEVHAANRSQAIAPSEQAPVRGQGGELLDQGEHEYRDQQQSYGVSNKKLAYRDLANRRNVVAQTAVSEAYEEALQRKRAEQVVEDQEQQQALAQDGAADERQLPALVRRNAENKREAPPAEARDESDTTRGLIEGLRKALAGLSQDQGRQEAKANRPDLNEQQAASAGAQLARSNAATGYGGRDSRADVTTPGAVEQGHAAAPGRSSTTTPPSPAQSVAAREKASEQASRPAALPAPLAVEKVVAAQELAELTEAQRVAVIHATEESTNPSADAKTELANLETREAEAAPAEALFRQGQAVFGLAQKVQQADPEAAALETYALHYMWIPTDPQALVGVRLVNLGGTEVLQGFELDRDQLEALATARLSNFGLSDRVSIQTSTNAQDVLALVPNNTTSSAVTDTLAPSRWLLYTSAGLIIFLTTAGLALLYRIVGGNITLARRRTDFVAAVSHELKAPLTAIRALAEMLGMGIVPTREKEMEYFRHIQGESERLSRLIANVLDLAKLERKKRSYRLSEGHVSPVVAALVDSFQPHLEGQGFAFTADIGTNLPPVLLDADAIAQVVANFLDNAIKYTQACETKRIDVRVAHECRSHGDVVIVEVKDSGIGIAKSEQVRLFERFERGQEPLAQGTGGAGLGLAIAKQHIIAHGGAIELESTPGSGSSFRIVLPVSKSPSSRL